MPTNFEANRSASEPKVKILDELLRLKAERNSRLATTLGRFLQCPDLQMASALLARAIEQCSRWHAGKRLPAPGGVLPPTC